jgi:hypothetical protein
MDNDTSVGRESHILNLFREYECEVEQNLFEVVKDFLESCQTYQHEILFRNVVGECEMKGVVDLKFLKRNNELIVQNIAITPMHGKILTNTMDQILNEESLKLKGLKKITVQSIETLQFKNSLINSGWIQSRNDNDVYKEIV